MTIHEARAEHYNKYGTMVDDAIIVAHYKSKGIELDMGTAYEAAYGYKNERSNKTQVGGDHYSKHEIQPIDIIREYKMDFFEGNALKYLLRYKDKNGVQDLDKALDYIMMIKDNIKMEKNI